MRVYSAVSGFFTDLLVRRRSGVWIVMLTIFFIASSFTENTGRDLRVTQVNLIIRQVGDRLLLQGGDSTSRVLPVTEIKNGTFLLRFENKFVFNHDTLMALSQRLLPKSQFPSGYTVTVHDCTKKEIVYGFQVNNNSPDILACKGRIQPAGCYTIEFAFPDFADNLTQKKDAIGQLGESNKVDPRELKSKMGEVKPTTFGPNGNQRTEEYKSDKVDSPKSNSNFTEYKTTNSNYLLVNVLFAAVLVLLGITIFIGRFGKMLKPVPLQPQHHAMIKEPVPELDALGKFLFNTKGQRLVLGTEVISLTDKECKVLKLLHRNFGELIPRETLMQEVWINEGVITGRSLDMFISKLRKKLSDDPDLRITNIHGKGYRLETLTDFIA